MLAKTISITALLFAGCASAGGPDHPEDMELGERLADPVAFSIASEGSVARVRAVALRDGSATEVALEIIGGSLTLSLDEGDLRVEGLDVGAADVTVGPGAIPPDGVLLTGIAVDLAAPATASVSAMSESSAKVAAEWDLDLRWAVDLDHGVVDLAPIRLPAMSFALSLEVGADGAIDARLTASQPGPFWSWAGIFELSDLELDLRGSTAGNVD